MNLPIFKRYKTISRLFIIISFVFGLCLLYSNVFDASMRVVYSQSCSRNCAPTNPPVNDTQIWVDALNHIKIQFWHMPQLTYMGNLTQLNFKIIGIGSNKLLDIKHISVTLIKNVPANLGNNASLYDKNNYVTIDNLTAINNMVSFKYRFSEGGIHQIILKVEIDEGISLSEFNIPVLKHWWDLI